MDRDEPFITRTLDVPRELVFKAWTDPDQVAKWSAPSGFSAPRRAISIDLRVGGRYDYCLVQVDDGAEFWLRNEIVELLEPRLLVLESDAMPEFGYSEPIITRLELQDDGGRTRIALSRPYPAERRATARASWNASLDKLEALLGTPN
jgi:uncharacterized protein YndB with AHSA1/START domain